ncbi:hypothetical protein IW261DRAFT_1373567 [Armillaria novae-zelandiae]|uniref:Heterokaryon incompatibility domain-containing protein n=1 Tax=Armillaria novae-zelandiae TaxID=153914 RepID=A0AA39NHJ1_9AGAR|nr:hypothetical protein IW261DRAFT_1373567 [Armillaria novae-zelandiae]
MQRYVLKKLRWLWILKEDLKEYVFRRRYPYVGPIYKAKDYTFLPKVTLTSLTETGRDKSTIPVLKQRSYAGRKIISSALANTRCADLGVEGVLEKLNNTLYTSYTLDSVISVLSSYVAQNVDFGTAYAYLRPYWGYISAMEGELSTRKEKDREMRENVLADGRITRRHVPPRRLWDLCANRVVPYWVANCEPWAISHAWVEEKDRVGVMTSINGCEWPVPMPKDANLDLIRIEMLNLMSKSEPRPKAEYAWLDVLCLRQEGGKNEHLRLDEWKLDVPTIGSVYEHPWSAVERSERVVYYLNGLGRPLRLTPGYFESDRCWFRRAWTLQEISRNPIIGGETRKNVTDKQVQRRFNEQLSSLQRMRRNIWILDFLSEMRNRVSTKPLDIVAGLVYLLRTNTIPIYDPMQSAEDAWEVLTDVMRPTYRAQLLFFYPEPGNGSKNWCPSWEQLMTSKTISPRFTGHLSGVENERSADYYMGHFIESGLVWGLGDVPNELTPRQGELVFNDDDGDTCTLKIVADHAYSIPDGVYTLLGCNNVPLSRDHWVVGQMRQDGRFEKLSVFRSARDEEQHLHHLKLGRLFPIYLC